MEDYRKIYYKDYYIKNKEKYKQYYYNNREEIIEKQLDYYQQNKFEIGKRTKIYFQQYYQKNKEKIIMRSQNHYYNGSLAGACEGKRSTKKPDNIVIKNEILENNIIIRLID